MSARERNGMPRRADYATAEFLLDLIKASPPEHPTERFLRMKAECEELLREEAALQSEDEVPQ